MKKNLLNYLFIITMFVLFLPKSAMALNFDFSLNNGTSSSEFGKVSPGSSVSGEALLKINEAEDVKNINATDFDILFKYLSGSSKIENLDSLITFPNGKKITLSKDEKQAKVPFTIKIPKNFSPGDYKFSIAARMDSSSKGTRNVGVSASPAAGFKIHFFIDGEIIKKISIKSFSLLPTTSGGHEVKFDYSNEGNVSIAPTAHVEVYSSDGKKILEKDQVFLSVDPGKSRSQSVILEGVDLNPFWGSFTIVAKIFNDEKGGKVDLWHDEIVYTIVPWKEISASLFFLVLIISYVLFKYLHSAILRRKSSTYTVIQGDTVQSLSLKFNSNANDIISVNSIKSPFILEIGSKILIPKK